MKRKHLIEISDETWCPRAIRYAATDYCQFVLALLKPYDAIAPFLLEALQETGSNRVLDLASGAGGPWVGLQPLLRPQGVDLCVCLSDYYPNLEAFERARRLTKQAISYHVEPVDAARVPPELPGFRTIFTAFHHFPPAQARAVLADAVAKGEGIAVFECGNRSLLTLLFTLFTPVRVLLMTPFIRPFRWSTLFWTYLLPVVPFVLLFDTIVSCLRVYSVPELRDLTNGLDSYRWEAGRVWSKRPPLPVTYLIGLPREPAGRNNTG